MAGDLCDISLQGPGHSHRPYSGDTCSECSTSAQPRRLSPQVTATATLPSNSLDGLTAVLPTAAAIVDLVCSRFLHTYPQRIWFSETLLGVRVGEGRPLTSWFRVVFRTAVKGRNQRPVR